jgi:hypothetical protein
MLEQKPIHEVEGIVRRALRQDCVAAQVRGTNIFLQQCSSSRTPVASIILKWKTFETTKTLPRAGHPAKLSNHGRRALVKDVTKNPTNTSGQVSECLWVAQPEPGQVPDKSSLERPEISWAATLLIQPDRAWEDLQRRMCETPQIQVCQASSVIPKKT